MWKCASQAFFCIDPNGGAPLWFSLVLLLLVYIQLALIRTAAVVWRCCCCLPACLMMVSTKPPLVCHQMRALLRVLTRASSSWFSMYRARSYQILLLGLGPSYGNCSSITLQARQFAVGIKWLRTFFFIIFFLMFGVVVLIAAAAN